MNEGMIEFQYFPWTCLLEDPHLNAFGSDFYAKAQARNWYSTCSYYISQQVNTLPSEILLLSLWSVQQLHAQGHFKRKRTFERDYLLCRVQIYWLSLALTHPPGARCPFDASKLTTLGRQCPVTTSDVPSGQCASDHHKKKPQQKCQGLLQSRDADLHFMLPLLMQLNEQQIICTSTVHQGITGLAFFIVLNIDCSHKN